MKELFRKILVLLCLGALAGTLGGVSAEAAQRRTERAILFIIDGLSFKAPQKLDLPNLKRLISQGVYYRSCFHPPTAHPPNWFHTCSVGNVALVTGTLFWKEGQEQLSEVFSSESVRKLMLLR